MDNYDHLLLFDGVCNLCNRLVIFIIRKDRHSKFKFASLQSPGAKIFLSKFGLTSKQLTSVIYIKGDKYFLKSTAILHVLKDLGSFWKLFFAFIILPAFIRNFFYDVLAKYRYKIFGKRDTCMVPGHDIHQRFVFPVEP